MAGTPFRVRDLRPDDVAWDGWLDRATGDIFHSAGYHSYSQTSGEGAAHLVVVGDADRGLLWPYLLRPILDEQGSPVGTLTDVTSVYGYPGPLAWGCLPGDALVAQAWLEIQAVWRSQGAVAAFTRFHPLLGNASLALGLQAAASNNGGVLAGGPTVSVDLTLGYEAAQAVYGRGLRGEIAQARRAGLITAVDRDWGELGTFAHLYDQTMQRLQAPAYYRFQEPDFVRLRDALGKRIHLLVAKVDGVVAAAGLFTVWEGLAEWYLVGTDAAYASMSPSKPLADFAIEWAGGEGAKVLHLGGGRGGVNDSLLWFKSRFSSRRHSFHTGRWVLDPVAAADLEATRRARLTEGVTLDPSYFPAYRAPAIPAQDPIVGVRAGVGPGLVAPIAWHGSPPLAALDITRVAPEDAAALGDLLANIDGTYFQPHAMTAREAIRIGASRGRDVYLIGRVHGRAVAYGLLRGWDEGYATPSVGVGVRRESAGHGYGRMMMEALHTFARAGGAERVRLRVHPANKRAEALYESMGYRKAGIDRHEMVMILDL